MKNRDTVIVDTGGLTFDRGETLEKDVQKQVTLAIQEADMIFFLTDASEELTGIDYRAAALLRKTKKPVIIIGNKSDRKIVESMKTNLYKLGLGEPFIVSAIHGKGIAELELETVKLLKRMFMPSPRKPRREKIMNLAIVGRPNVGKSRLVNSLLGEERVIVSEIPGTTVDVTDTLFIYGGQKCNLIDTAGLRRRGRIQKGLEKISVLRALSAISRADVVVLLLDAKEGITQQDCHVSEFILEAGKGLILAVNKCDLFEHQQEDKNHILRALQAKMAYIPWAPVIFISALMKKNIFTLLEVAMQIMEERNRKIPDTSFGHFLQQSIAKHPPPSWGGKPVRIFGGRQVGKEPPSFVIETNYPDDIHFSYRRYLENALRKTFGFNGTAIRISYEAKGRS